VTGIAGEHSGRGGRVESNMIEEPERGLSRTGSGPRLSHVNIVDREGGERLFRLECGKAAQNRGKSPSIFVAGSQVLSFTK
jgi:hypothetical protein